MKLVLFAALLATGAQVPTYKGQPRDPHPFAPSLPKLTEKEYAAIADIVDRFIDQDIGKLKGQEAAKALSDFKALGPEAFFALVEGLNKAANMEDSCPAVLIAKKVIGIIGATKDAALLEFARENIGAEVTAKRHLSLLADVRTAVVLRRAAVNRMQLAANKQTGGAKQKEKAPKKTTAAELAIAANRDSASGLKNVLLQMADRKGEPAIPTLGVAAKKENSKLTEDWIAALADPQETVRQAARAALVKKAGGAVDHGPQLATDPAEWARAQERWRAYWKRNP